VKEHILGKNKENKLIEILLVILIDLNEKQ